MGVLISCCRGSSSDYVTPDVETRRQQVAEAAERRLREQESRGVKDPERVKRMQLKSEELEKREREAGYQQGGGGGLRWQVE